MNKYITWVVGILFSVHVCAENLNLINGVTRSEGKPDSEITMELIQLGAYGLVSYMQLPNENVYYTLIGETFGRFDLKNKKYLGNIELTPWPYRYASPAVIVQYGELALEYPSTSSDFEYHVYPGVGCYGESPLRYGDVEGDGKNELVLFLGDFFIIFSPETGKTVFSEKLSESDWLNDEEMRNYYKISGEGTRPTAQYVSLLHNENNSFAIGLRAYAKLYFGDFDKDGNPDILAWRKAYRSNAGTNPIKGFTKIEESLQHFKRSPTGEYLPQNTSPETIQNWLSSNNLTWQKGFPSKSECAGEEGKLIPEMHDVLLNDPDVLK